MLVNEALTKNRDGLFLRLDWGIGGALGSALVRLSGRGAYFGAVAEPTDGPLVSPFANATRSGLLIWLCSCSVVTGLVEVISQREAKRSNSTERCRATEAKLRNKQQHLSKSKQLAHTQLHNIS